MYVEHTNRSLWGTVTQTSRFSLTRIFVWQMADLDLSGGMTLDPSQYSTAFSKPVLMGLTMSTFMLCLAWNTTMSELISPTDEAIASWLFAFVASVTVYSMIYFAIRRRGRLPRLAQHALDNIISASSYVVLYLYVDAYEDSIGDSWVWMSIAFAISVVIAVCFYEVAYTQFTGVKALLSEVTMDNLTFLVALLAFETFEAAFIDVSSDSNLCIGYWIGFGTFAMITLALAILRMPIYRTPPNLYLEYSNLVAESTMFMAAMLFSSAFQYTLSLFGYSLTAFYAASLTCMCILCGLYSNTVCRRFPRYNPILNLMMIAFGYILAEAWNDAAFAGLVTEDPDMTEFVVYAICITLLSGWLNTVFLRHYMTKPNGNSFLQQSSSQSTVSVSV